MNLKSMLEAEERTFARRQRLEAERVARGEPAPANNWKPPDPNLDAWGKPLKKPRRR